MDLLSEEVLLEISEFHVKRSETPEDMGWNAWHLLIHVCRRWRNIVLSLSRRLNLRLLCTERTPVTEMLDIWPAFLPIIIRSGGKEPPDDDEWNVLSALKHTGRVCEIIIFDDIASQFWEVFSAEKHGPFPLLTSMMLKMSYRGLYFFPDPFLDWSTRRLRSLDLDSIPFSAVHTLLLSASGLVYLSLWNLPAYVFPEVIAPCLASMAGLESMYLGFRDAEYHPHQERQHSYPLPRTVFPALTYLGLNAPNGYSEDLMARLDTPRLD
jgi:hypothetical protein